MNQHPSQIAGGQLSRQAGAITLLTAVIILMMATVLVIAVSRTTIMEQRISGNQIRSRQASAAAEAGLNAGLSYIVFTTVPTTVSVPTKATLTAGSTVPAGADKDNNSVSDAYTAADGVTGDTALKTLTSGTSNKYSVSFCDPTENLVGVSCPDAPGAVICTAAPANSLNKPRIVACGWSDDGLGRTMISQSVGTLKGINSGPTNPLTAKGAVNVQGSATVTNYYNNLTVWSGGALSDIGNAGKTFVRNPTVAPPDAITPPPAPPTSCTTTANYVCTTDKNSTGPDVIDNDPTLGNITDAQMFTNYFGVASLAAYKATVATLPNITDGTVGSLSGVLGQAIVVNGNLSSNMNFTIGSRDRPVVLIIDGNWTGGGNTTIYGVVYVTGNVDLAGTKTIYGGTVIEGNVAGTGSLDLIYDPVAVSNAANGVGRSGWVPGSWRDWK
jgi:Tfp pilus assembly protein PilX